MKFVYNLQKNKDVVTSKGAGVRNRQKNLTKNFDKMILQEDHGKQMNFKEVKSAFNMLEYLD